jgi:hypothetical protein
MTLNKKLQELAKDAGFIFWADEPYGPGPDNIDWSSMYDEQLQGFYDRMLEEVIRTVEESCKKKTFTTHDQAMIGGIRQQIIEDLLKEFGK